MLFLTFKESQKSHRQMRTTAKTKRITYKLPTNQRKSTHGDPTKPEQV